MIIQDPTQQMSAQAVADEKTKWSILARIMLAQQKLYETNLGESLRERETVLHEHKFQMKYLDQELIMIKIEMALLKCQLEEYHIEQLEIQRQCQFVDETQMRQKALEAYNSTESGRGHMSSSQRAK